MKNHKLSNCFKCTLCLKKHYQDLDILPLKRLYFFFFFYVYRILIILINVKIFLNIQILHLHDSTKGSIFSLALLGYRVSIHPCVSVILSPIFQIQKIYVSEIVYVHVPVYGSPCGCRSMRNIRRITGRLL